MEREPAHGEDSQLSAAFAVIDHVMASNRRAADRLRGSVVIDRAPRPGEDHHRHPLRPRLPPLHLPPPRAQDDVAALAAASSGHPAANRATSIRLGALAGGLCRVV